MRWPKLLSMFLLGASAVMVCAQTNDSQAFLVHKKKYVMGSVFEVAAYGDSQSQLSDAIDLALAEIVRLDDVMSDYKTDSDLSRLNHSSHSGPETIPRDLYRVIDEALRYSRLSGGKFDVTVGPLVNLWKAAVRTGHAPSSADEKKARDCVGYQKIELLPPDRIQFHSSCVQIDLGAIGKGYALDRAAEVLSARGITRALLDAGGSTIVAMGAPPGQSGWLVHLRDPSNKVDPHVTLSGRSVSTSEQTPRSLVSAERAGHIVDPDKGVPAETHFAVSAVAENGTASDALSTTLLLLGPERGKELITKNVPSGAAIWVYTDGQTQIASNGPQILRGGGATAATQPDSGGLR
jgi:FAD:protein FMN transferase